METMEFIETETVKKVADKALEVLYENAFPLVAGFIRKAGGNLDEARDIFHDALLIYFEENNKKTLLNSNAYLLGIAKHLWNRKFRNSNRQVPLSEMEMQLKIPDDFYVSVKTQKLISYLERAGKKCMDLLRAFYFQKQKIKTLVKNLGFSNEHSASVQKYKCLEKVREIVKQKSLSYEDFVE